MSESIIEKALLEAEQLEETMKSNAKEILSSTMKEEISELVKESLSEEDDYLKEQEDTEQEVDMDIGPMGDVDMELDIEDETDDMITSDELPPLDLTLASDEEVLKVFKAMGSEDGIIVQQDDGEISFTDGDEEYLIKLEENKKTMKKEPMYEIHMDAEEEFEEEPMYEIEMDEEEGMPGHHEHPEYQKTQGYNARLDDTLGMKGGAESTMSQTFADRRKESEGMEKAMGGHKYGSDQEMEEQEYEIELEEGGEHAHDQGYDDREDESLGMRAGAEATKQVSMKGRRDDSYGAFGKRGIEHPGQGINKSEVGEASRTYGSGSKRGRGLRKAITPNRNYDYPIKESARTKGRQLQENYHRLKEEVNNLKGKNGEYRNALVSFKQKLNEVGVFNSNLAYATRLFTEHSTTKSEKVNVLRRFDNVKSLKQSKDLYRVIREELSQNKPSITKSKKSISEAVNRRINSTLKSGSNIKLMESKVYENPQFTRIKDLMSKL